MFRHDKATDIQGDYRYRQDKRGFQMKEGCSDSCDLSRVYLEHMSTFSRAP